MDMAILVTKWFGAFLIDEKSHSIIDKRLMPMDAQATAEKLAAIQRGGILDEERELSAKIPEKLKVGDRRQSELGKPEMFDSSFLSPQKFGYDDAFMHEVMMGLGKLRTSEPIPRDKSLVQAIRNLDDQIATINLYNERLHEWYGMHFPELADYAKDSRYADLIARYGDRDSVTEELGIDIQSIGADLDDSDIRAVMDLADTLCRLYDDKDRTEEYIEGIVSEACPNVCALVGGPLAARLISLSGGLERLASLPSSTVQLLGAEKAMFRHLRSNKKCPKHGVIYQCPDIHKAPYWQRGKIARALSGKISIAAKIDQYHGEFCGDRLKEEFARRVEDIQRRYPDPPKRPEKKKNRPRNRGKGKKR
jgi:nucleolar protein 56